MIRKKPKKTWKETGEYQWRLVRLHCEVYGTVLPERALRQLQTFPTAEVASVPRLASPP